MFVGVAETIVSSLLWCSLGIAQCLSNLLYHVTGDCTRPKHKDAPALRHNSGSDSVIYDLVKTRLSESQGKAEEISQSRVKISTMWLVYPSASASDSTIWFSLDHKRRRHKGSRMKTETFWFFRFWFRRASGPPITTPSVVKTSLNITQARSSGYLWDIKHVLPNIEWKKPRHPEPAFSNYTEMQFHWTRNKQYFKMLPLVNRGMKDAETC